MTPRAMFVINGLGTGGAERSLAELLPRFRDAGWECDVVALFRRHEGVAASVEADGFPITVLAASTFAGRVRELRARMRDTAPDVVHTAIFEADVVGRVASAGLPVAVVSTLVNTSYEDARLDDPNVTVWRLRAAQVVDAVTGRLFVDHFIAITEAVAASAARRLRVPRGRITVIPRGRAPERLGEPSAARRAASRRNLGVAEDAEVLVSVGRQEYQKGQRDLLEAVAVLAESRPALVVLVAGREGNATPELQARMADPSFPSDHVRFLGHVDDVGTLLAAGDLFVFPSRYEGFGGSLVEAMALGLPIVASDIPAVREVVAEGTNAVLVPAGSSTALAAAVAALLDDPSRRRGFGAASRQRFLERFTIESSAARTIALFDGLRRGSPGRPRVRLLVKGLGPGGAETLLVFHARRGDKARFDYSLSYTLPHKDHLVAAVRAAGVRVTEPRDSRRWVLDLWRSMARGEVDVVHTHSPVPAVAARLASRLVPPRRRPRLVYTEHNRWPSHHRLTRALNRLTIGLDDHVFAVSDEVRESMGARVRARVESLVHGIDTGAVAALTSERAAVRAELGVGDDEVVAVTVANYREKKDYPTLLAAARDATAEHPHLRFVAIGQGPLAAEIERAHRDLGLGDRFLLLGYRPDAVRVMAGGDLFVLSSRHEGLPVALMEALALGLPVVSTAVGGVPEAVADGREAALVPPGDPAALAKAILALAADADERARRGAAARASAGRFDGEPAVRRQEAVYERLARG